MLRCGMAAFIVVLGVVIALSLATFGEEKASRGAKVCIVLVGDSTVTDEAGWGAGFKAGLRPDAECINAASSGRSSKSYRTEGLWDKALKNHPNYVLIQFGHNDEPGKGEARETDPNTTYSENMARYVDEARKAGAKPVLVTSIARRRFSADGKASPEPSLSDYVEAVKKVAAKKRVPLLDMQARTLKLYSKLGSKGCEDISPVKDGKVDGTHLNAHGSEIVGGMVIEELRKAVPALAPYFKKASKATQPDKE